MLIAELLAKKGAEVATVATGALISEVVAGLAAHGVGALVVSDDAEHVDGIVSERDVVRAIGRLGAGVLGEPVRAIMSASVYTCEPDETVDALAAMMTEHRIRHVPVLSNGELAGIVSIGDVVKSRIDELEQDRKALEHYITAR
ncbi:MAG: CBS domain-containing protein [Actinomycetota bacterium]|nr:CBS domain-containing protein [Actinomycetota bacterium]